MSLRLPDPEPGVPIWVLSFGDMITNLLAFFILLQSFSHAQRSEICQTGDAPITTSLTNFGGPAWLFGKRHAVNREFRLRKYPMEDDPEAIAAGRVIDAEDEKIRKLFDDLRQAAETRASDDSKAMVRVFPTPLEFAPGSAELDADATDFLTTFVAELQQNAGIAKADLYVVGTAPDADSKKAQYTLSARRAKAVADALARNLPAAKGATPPMAWGIGSGRRGMGLTAAAKPPSIVIAVAESPRQE